MEIAQPHSQVLEEKLQRVLGTNAQLKADLERNTDPVSKASQRLIHYATTTTEPLLGVSVGSTSEAREAPKSPGCCIVM
ncbi:uncharacterized protein MJAP1_002778 [Malassezia japonica]|uniref:G protein gamma domain-containing protein n=1 Tax=Malassezia japonica TaxID=223818 RepID=A0AAF0F3B3_9BASI|nr:uncharacterized protein MJAP1_002778 [Malassezia japonica]WFD39797.1 hypothetical protein MJAP1_002778 [Malassezia japonica]